MDTREVMLVRLPLSLKEAMRERALANKRSVTKEIEFALERYIAAPAAAHPQIGDASNG